MEPDPRESSELGLTSSKGETEVPIIVLQMSYNQQLISSFSTWIPHVHSLNKY